MKKFAVVLMALLLGAVLFTSAFADAELAIKDSTLIIFDEDDDGFFYALVENVGDTGGYVNSGTLNIYDENNEAFVQKNYVGTVPSSLYLEPGEYAYIRTSLWEKSFLEKKATNFDYMPEIKKYGNDYYTIPCDIELYYPGPDSWDNTLFVTFTNNSDTMLHDFEIIAAMYATDGDLIFVNQRSYSEVGVHPGSTVTISITIGNDSVKYFNAHNITPDRLDAIVYVEK